MTSKLPPFSCTYSASFVKLLHGLRSSIAITTYQAGKLIFISAKNETELIQFPRTFIKPMGIALHDDKLAVATQDDVAVYRDVPGQGKRYPKRPDTYDALYLPRSIYYTGELDIHDIQFIPAGLLAVNTRFSCVSLINEDYSFTCIWKPYFIDQLIPGDCCHLNGMVVENDKPRYLTALGATSDEKGWRSNKANGGILIDAITQEFVLENLPMPHSPRKYREGLFALLSGTGELIHVNCEKKSYEVVHRFDGFVRGMDRIGDFLFIGLSKLRTTSKAFGDLPIASRSLMCGVVAFHLPTAKIVGHIKYESSVEEIFDVQVLPGIVRPGILSIEKNEHQGIITVPDGVYWPIKSGNP
ncbi:MAG TPA: TIGR03032 family protein [Cyclobacteriaceae bacterium]|nr:TIGR03032 family protein [Cyclobacteriaceae bacterium]